jgi:holo-[acyl-carrier protein] synthase
MGVLLIRCRHFETGPILSRQVSQKPHVWFLGDSHRLLRWAAKEAAYKAMYPRFRPTWKDLDVAKADGLKPSLRYCASGAGKLGLRFHLSVSHDGDYTVATVLVED